MTKDAPGITLARILMAAPGKELFVDGPPVRLQLRRTAGFNLQKLSRDTNGRAAVNCARPGPRGNPFVVGDNGMTAEHACIHFKAQLKRNGWFVNTRGKTVTVADIRRDCRGKNLACFCPLDSPHCHVDTLLEVANGD